MWSCLEFPRDGVPVALEVTKELHVPLDIFLSRKLGVDGQEEIAFGAIASGGVRVLDRVAAQPVARAAQERDSSSERNSTMIPVRKQPSDFDTRDVLIDLEGVTLQGSLTLPKDARGLVLFAHGSGSSRHSPRNLYVAQILHSHGIGTLLFDLLTRHEESVDQYSGELRFDIPFLARRLVEATRWLKAIPGTKELQVGYFAPAPVRVRRL
jgi:hypothetical protein